MKTLSTLSLFLVILASPAFADSPAWRGDGAGRYPDAAPPIQWDAEDGKNVLWQTKIGKGQSSPLVVGDRVFATVEPDGLVCLDRAGGKVLWRVANGYDTLPSEFKPPKERPATSPNCGYAAATPTSDGKAVYASYGTGVIVCYDLAGRRRWVQYLDRPLATQYGRSPSPLLAAGKLLVNPAGLVALDAETGNVCWEAPEAKATYGTPAVVKVGGEWLALTPGGDCVRVGDGRILARKIASLTYTSPVVDGRVVYYLGSTVVAVELPETAGEPLALKRLWENDDPEGEFFASPLVHDGLVYCASNEGTLYVLDAKTSKTVFQKELEIRSASGKPGAEPAAVYPSPTLAGKHLLLGNDAGETLVLEPGRQYRPLGRNVLDRGCGASPVADGKQLFLRGGEWLYAIGSR
jgi:outer membrane protein assembly factor BamB